MPQKLREEAKKGFAVFFSESGGRSDVSLPTIKSDLSNPQRHVLESELDLSN
jgi:hypothetical protein